MAKYRYTVNITRTVTSCGDFEVASSKKLTEDEVLERAQAMANEGQDPTEGGWEEADTAYDDAEITDGNDDLKEE